MPAEGDAATNGRSGRGDATPARTPELQLTVHGAAVPSASAAENREDSRRGRLGELMTARGGEAHEPLVLTVTEAANILGISRSFAYELCRTGELPALRLGRRVMVPRRALFDFVETSGAEPARSSSILSRRVRPQSSAAAASATGRTLA